MSTLWVQRLMAALVVLALPLAGAAQTESGRVTGTVIDESGAVLPGATITLRGDGTDVVRTTQTDAAGQYVIADVPPGPYELTIEMSGFTRQLRKVVVGAGQTISLEARLLVGGQAEEIQVTGSLIPRPTLEAMSPVTTLDPQEITYRGISRMEDILMALPQVFAAQNSTIANGASGTATVDLRYLGPERTLVLIDGRRMSSGDAFETAPDLNFIPSALVKRVDILSGGASSVYGADAVAGVVNFVLDRDFEGLRGGFQFGGYQHNNDNDVAQAMNSGAGFTAPTGSTWNQAPSDFNVAFGGRFGDRKGHAAAYIDYRTMDAITKDARDYTNCSGSMGDSGPVCGGSGTWQDGRFLTLAADGSARRGDYVLDVNSPGGNQFRPRNSATDVYNYAPANFMQRPDTRWAGGGFVTYDFNRYATGYAEVMVMDDYTDAQIAPSGNFGNSALLNCDNPMLSDQQRQLLCTDMGYGPNDIADVIIYRRNIEGGGRVSQLRHTALRFSGGVKGDINDVWSYDAYGLHAQVNSPQKYANDLNAVNIQDALLVQGNPADPSTWQCMSGNPGCVPWNIFQAGGVTDAALDYLRLPMVLDSGVRTRGVEARLTGDLKGYGAAFASATEGFQVALGGAYREEYLYVDPDLAFMNMMGAGQGSPTLPVNGEYNVKEFFAEGLIPIVQDSPGFQDLTVELGYRYSDYSSTGGWPTYKFQAAWAPMDDLKIRAGFNRATRSPNVRELYRSQSIALNGSDDICAGTSPSATQEQCVRLGVPASWYGQVLDNPAEQYNTFDGGNPELKPEIADTWTAGLVVTPSAVRGFTVALDFFKVKLEDTIGSLGPEDIQTQCAATGNEFLCGLIHRDRLFTLWATTDGYTITLDQNIGKREAQGLDLVSSFARPIGGAGNLSVSFIGSYLMNSKTDTGLYAYDCVGYFGEQCGIPNPSWRHLARFSFDTNFNTTFSLAWRLIGPVTHDDGSPNEALASPANVEVLQANDIYEIPTFNFFDLAVTYRLAKNYRITAGVNNLFDKEPPLAPGNQDNDYGPGFYGTYDPLGRYVFMGVQFTF